ncbi:hypothetical protein POM88_014021 [Heracleum sosnowskyi]|uniref:Uncharacterized protein n=1 Tax=Heracleum sosnowskyi TaxID=360622 RepID=A0AAD8MYM8_9APIA|nr:hypothetical protein POM88_014021 [Heracleum sosnowskyi]
MPRVNWFEKLSRLKGYVKNQHDTSRSLIANNYRSRGWMLAVQDLVDNVIRFYPDEIPRHKGEMITCLGNSYPLYAQTALKYCKFRDIPYESDYPYTGTRNTKVSQNPIKWRPLLTPLSPAAGKDDNTNPSSADLVDEHAVAVIGMDTDLDIHEIQNSEGEEWSVNGVGRIRCSLVYNIPEQLDPSYTPLWERSSKESKGEKSSK